MAAARSPKPSALSARAALAVNIIKRRNELGWTQEVLAFEAGLHRTFIAHTERQVRNISLDNIERIAVALKVAPYELLVPPTGL